MLKIDFNNVKGGWKFNNLSFLTNSIFLRLIFEAY